MIHKTESSLPGHVRIVFELPSSVWANQIKLQGEFNNWSEVGEPLCQERDGHWRTAIDLPAGKSYEFRYLVDGQHLVDIRADGLSDDPMGIQNSIVHTDLSTGNSSPDFAGYF